MAPEDFESPTVGSVITTVYDFASKIARSIQFSAAAQVGVPDLKFSPGLTREVKNIIQKDRRALAELAFYIVVDNSGYISHLQHRDLIGYVQLARDFGLFEKALSLTSNMSSEDGDESFKVALLRAKGFRGCSRYEDARAIYHNLLRTHVDAQSQSARVLLHLAKLSHSFEWRVGTYRHLILCARSRFVSMLDDPLGDEADCRHRAAVCDDCLATVDYEDFKIAQPHGADHGPVLARILSRLENAVEQAKDSGQVNAWLRRKFHYLNVLFDATPEQEPRREVIRKFARLTLELRKDDSHARGVAVRLGQLADMQMRVGDYGESEDYLHEALLVGRQVSDWRSVTENHVRLAWLQVLLRRKRSEFSEQLNLARQSLTKLDGKHPELELKVFSCAAEEARLSGMMAESLLAFQALTRLLDRLQLRIELDVESATNDASEHFFFLTPTEQAKTQGALLTDYRILANIQKSTFRSMSELTAQATRVTSLEQYEDLLAIHSSSVLHRLKNITEISREAILRPLRGMPVSQPQALRAIETVNCIFDDIRTWENEIAADLRLMGDSVLMDLRLIVDDLKASLHFETLRDPDLVVVWPQHDQIPDVMIECYPPIFKQAIISLIENAARIAYLHAPDRNAMVNIRFMFVGDRQRFVGIEIRDNGANADSLRRELEALELIPVTAPRRTPSRAEHRTSGLLLAAKVFAPLGAEYAVDTEENGAITMLRIVFHHIDLIHRKGCP